MVAEEDREGGETEETSKGLAYFGAPGFDYKVVNCIGEEGKTAAEVTGSCPEDNTGPRAIRTKATFCHEKVSHSECITQTGHGWDAYHKVGLLAAWVTEFLPSDLQVFLPESNSLP